MLIKKWRGLDLKELGTSQQTATRTRGDKSLQSSYPFIQNYSV